MGDIAKENMGLIVRLLLLLGFGFLLKTILTKKERIVSIHSDSHNEFLDFNKNLVVTKSKIEKLNRGYNTIKRLLKSYFGEHRDFSIPKFAKQGSSETGTMIRTVDDTCDFDIGIYFFEKPKKTYETIQEHISNALQGHTSFGGKCLKKCVRLIYSGDFHIDMPVYYKSKEGNFLLGSKGDLWEICDSKFFKDWVIESTYENEQILRIIRYFKAWSDHYRFKKSIKMPSGLVFTIWVIEHYKEDRRDDVAFILTASEILQYLGWNLTMTWTCEMPVEPYDNVLEKLNGDQQTNFRNGLKELVELGSTALSQDDKSKSIKIWMKLLGKRFNPT
ncbi:cyclic GMP-AMP synthase DncV-like nucleotidyltransferase [Ekhidna sp.]